MLLEVLIIGFGEIPSVVDAAAFPALLCGLGYKQRGGEHILAFPAGRRVEDFIHHVPLPESYNFLDL